MNYKKLFILLLSLSFFTGCGSSNISVNTISEQTIVPTGALCQQDDVVLENYGDPGKRLANCFVQYPGEPSRDDGYYHVVEDICGQFTKEFMQNFVDSPIVKIESQNNMAVHNCSYYFSDTDYFMLSLNYLSAENQKKGHEILGRKVKLDPNIKMDNFVIYQDDGLINEIYLVFYESKYISINRTSEKYLDNEKFLQMAIKLSSEIQDYK